MKKALIFGVTGQDGSFLAELLIKKNYIVHGVKRRSSLINTSRIDNLFKNKKSRFFLHYGDLLDEASIYNLIETIKPNEIYNLAAQSHVKVSFEMPLYTSNVNALGCLRILEYLRNNDKKKKIKFYQASSSEMFGNSDSLLTEKSKFNPQSSYAVAKVFAHYITKNYREAYGIYASSGILFNHESERRGETFVTKKIVSSLVRISRGSNEILKLGNLYAKRDWGYAKEFVEAMWMIMQKKKADDYVISTGKSYSVKDFINMVLKELKLKVNWKGKGLNECAFLDGKKIILIDKRYFRPTEVHALRGNFYKAKKALNWKPKISINKLVRIMINKEIEQL